MRRPVRNLNLTGRFIFERKVDKDPFPMFYTNVLYADHSNVIFPCSFS